MRKKINEWLKAVALLLALCVALSAAMPGMAYAVETETPDASDPSGSVPVTPEPSEPTQPGQEPAPSTPAEPGVDAPPVVHHLPITTVVRGEEAPLVVTATDEMGIAYVQVFYRAVGALEWIPREMLPDEGDSFVYTISAAEISDSGMEYYIEVSDGSNVISVGSESSPIRFVYAINFTMSTVSPGKVDVSQVSGGILATLVGSGFVREGMQLSVGGVEVAYTYLSENKLQFTLPVLDMGAADVVLSCQDTTKTLAKAIVYDDASSLLYLNYTAEAESNTAIRIPVSAFATGRVSSVSFKLKMDTAAWENVSFAADGENTASQVECTDLGNGVYQVDLRLDGGLSLNRTIGYITATAKADTGDVTAHIDVESANFNDVPVSLFFGCNIKILDKTPPVITIAPFDTAPTNQPVTVYAVVNEGTLNMANYTFIENGSILFEAVDASGNRSEVTVTVSNIYKNFTLELLNVPENMLIIEGTELDTTGWELKVVYDCGVEPAIVPVTKEMLAPPVTAPGQAVGLIIYNGISAEFTYEILPRAEAELTVTKLPDKLEYLPGEALDLTGMELTLSCGEKYLQIIPADQFTVTGFDAAAYGSQLLTVTYGSFTTSFPVSVKSPIPENITSDVYTIQDGFISGIACGTTLDILLDSIPENEYLRVMDGQTEVSIDELLSTGMTIQLVDGDNVIQSLTVVVTGDVNGDGKITVTDMIAIKAHILGNKILEGAAYMAADYKTDGNITVTDFIQIKSYILNDGD